ncbi:Tf2-6, partial [Mucuna pruriens]
MCDASNSALGVVLGQRASVDKPVHVIAYASQTMDATQLNYTTIEKELLAIVFALDKFCSYLLGSKIVVFSNHAALRFLLKKLDAKLRLIRWMLLIQEFNIKIIYKKGDENSVADHLSQIDRGNDPMPIRDEFPNEKQLHINTPTPWFADIYNFVFPLEASRLYKERQAMPNTTYGTILTYGDFVMIKLFAGAFLTSRSIRSSSFVMQHLEVAIMDQLRRSGRDAYQFVSTCEKCQKAGVAISKRHEMPQQPILFYEVFDVWGIHFMVPFPVSNGYAYILLVVDYISRWVKVIATKTNDAKVVVDFLKSNIFCWFGVPKVLISDQGSYFCNRAMSSLIHKCRTNDQAEVFNKEIKKTLQNMTNPNRKDWIRLLEDALWAHRTTYRTPLGISPYQIVFDKSYHLLVETEHRAY